ncbi:hypothetical protein [Rhizobium sp. AN69]|uniref:hypothetical protein n=1 Tax=Rhizobium sp. AN69 TaxID=3035213 RepID=UPI002B25740F|nr:hypothetical protein [Rhizobium sp. AN69]
MEDVIRAGEKAEAARDRFLAAAFRPVGVQSFEIETEDLRKVDDIKVLFLFLGFAIIGDNSLCSRWQNKVFNFLGAAMIVYGAANSLATAYVRLST